MTDQQPIEIVADIETGEFLEETTRIWCLSIGAPGSGEMVNYTDHVEDAPSLAERLSKAGTVSLLGKIPGADLAGRQRQ